MTAIKNLLSAAAKELRCCSSTARLDAELLLGQVLGLSRVELISQDRRSLDAGTIAAFQRLWERRRRHEPVAYIVGRKEFWGLDFKVTPAVLIPRPETELLVETALKSAAGRDGSLDILDMGTGSGCIAAAVAFELQRLGRSFSITATDVSLAALVVAKGNIGQLGLGLYVKLVPSDLFTELAGQCFDLIVSNPPYVPFDQAECSPELKYEPPEALYAGTGGLAFVEAILKSAPVFLKPEGEVMLEIGAEQGSQLRPLLAVLYAGGCYGGEPEYLADLAGRDRVLHLRAKKNPG